MYVSSSSWTLRHRPLQSKVKMGIGEPIEAAQYSINPDTVKGGLDGEQKWISVLCFVPRIKNFFSITFALSKLRRSQSPGF